MGDLEKWLEPQQWVRDKSTPCLALGADAGFDHDHLFAPCAVRWDDGTYRLYYCGANGTVADRVYSLGLATSRDGVDFERHGRRPVLGFADGKRSILTPCLLRRSEGTPCREDGRLRLWFSACDFAKGDGFHALHEATSEDGVVWSEPGPALLEHVYAPSVLKLDDTYHLWYTDVSGEPWKFRYATSIDGRSWSVAPEIVLELDQPWERTRIFYPFVAAVDGGFVMWYGAYSLHDGKAMKTALGVAVSPDGIHWTKSVANPIFGPEPAHAWESHYTTSETVLPLPGGGWRIWYATRSGDFLGHKYFAIGTAHWAGPTGI